MPARHALTDAQWAQLQPHLPGRDGDRGRTAADNRLFLDAVLYVARTGIPWRDLPPRYGKWNSVWRRFDRWSANGVWERLIQQVPSVFDDADLEELHLDSTSIKAQASAAGSRRRPGEKNMTPTNAGR